MIIKLHAIAGICSMLLAATLASAQCPSIQLPGGVVVYPNGVGFINSEGVAEYQSCHPRPAPRPPRERAAYFYDAQGHLTGAIYRYGVGYYDEKRTAVYEPWGPFPPWPLSEKPASEGDHLVAPSPGRTPTFSGLGINPLPDGAPAPHSGTTGALSFPPLSWSPGYGGGLEGDPQQASRSYAANCESSNPQIQFLTAYDFRVDVSSVTFINQGANGMASVGGVELSTTAGSPNVPGTVSVSGTGDLPDGTGVAVQAVITNGLITSMTLVNPNGTTTLCNPMPNQTTGLATGTQLLTADPISTASGQFIAEPAVDLWLGGPLPLFLRRSYSSSLFENSDVGILGTSWMTNFEPYINGDGKTFIAIMENGRVSFVLNGGVFQTAYPPRLPYQLVQSTSGGYRFYDAGKNLIYDFNANGKLIAIEDRNGNSLTVTQGSPGPTEVSDGLGRTLNFSYAAGNLVSVTDQTGRSVAYGQTNGILNSATDANNNATKYAYSPFREITQITRPLHNVPVGQSYDALFRVANQNDSEGNMTAFSYIAGGTPGLTKVTDPLGRTTTFHYANLMDLSSFTDADGNTASVDYDSRSRPTTFTDRLGNTLSVAYDAASGYPASVTDAKGNTTRYTYQSQVQGDFTFYNLTEIGYADGTKETFSYDGSGNMLKATDRAGNPTNYTYNTRGQALTVTNAAGGVTTFTYNADGTMATERDPAGNITTYSYDNLKRFAKIQHPDQTSVSYAYDALDHLLSITNENGKVTKFGYDANTNLKSTTDELNQTTTISYDTDDLPSVLSDPQGDTTTFQYDPLGSATAVVDAASEKTTYTYDNLERLSSALDPSGKGPSFMYDAEGHLTSFADALGNTAKFTVDPLGRTIGVASPLGENTAFTYDGLSRVASITDALSRTTRFSYESRGLLNGISGPGGLTTGFTWGSLPVLASWTDPNGNKWPVSYDSLGLLTSITDPLGQPLKYSYDNRNRVASISSKADSVQIAYDAAGNALQAKYSDGTSADYSYDSDNRLTGGTGLSFAYDAAGRLISSNGLAISYDRVGRISSVTYPAGKVTYSYDSRGLLSQVSDWVGGTVSFTFNDAHQLVSIARSNGVVTHYSYDQDGRLASILEASAAGSLAAIDLTRDALGRVTAANRNLPQEAAPATPGILPLSYDAADRISGFTYDARGRLTQGDAGSMYTWNPASRLVSYARSDGSASFTYDGLGQRISRTGSDGTTQNYILNYATGLPSAAVFRSENSDVTYYVYAPDGSVLYSIDAASGGHHFYSFDETGSTTFLTGDNGAITDSYGISPYGDVVTAGSSNKTDNPFTWQGQFGVMEEPGTSLFYMRFRYYDSAFARFLSRDPFISPDPLEINPYQYAAGNPVANVDAAGLSKTAGTPPFTGGLATLVFPFVTNANGFDAGLAITNTSADPFGTSPRLCSPSPGSAFGFSGYVIAVCNFQAAHGYAFIGDGLGSGGVASNYLAMIR